jgi:hypothetical protein
MAGVLLVGRVEPFLLLASSRSSSCWKPKEVINESSFLLRLLTTSSAGGKEIESFKEDA